MTEYNSNYNNNSFGVNNETSSNLDDNEFNDKINDIMNAIGIKDEDIRKKIHLSLANFKDSEKFKLINNIDMNTQYQSLIEKDNELKNLFDKTFNDNTKDNSEIKDNWDKMISELAELQGLIILKKVKKDCNSTINALLKALSGKLSIINDLLKSELNTQIGGSINNLQYKTKYLKLSK